MLRNRLTAHDQVIGARVIFTCALLLGCCAESAFGQANFYHQLGKIPPVTPPAAEPFSATARYPLSMNSAAPVNLARLPEVLPTGRYPLATADSSPATARLPSWQQVLHRQMLKQNYAVPLTVEQLMLDAVQHSLFLRSNSLQPVIESEAWAQTAATFDRNAFVSTRWQDLNTPGSTSLATGGPFIFQNKQSTNEVGVQRRNQLGGDVTVGQSFNFQNTNSLFFSPPNQGTSTLRLNYTQPLLRGAGLFYNRSIVVQAELKTETARQNYLQQLQDHLLSVNQAYWELYAARGAWVQQHQLYDRADKIIAKLKLRENIDGAKDQILRAEATAAQRKSTLVRSQKQVLDAQAKLRLLVNSPQVADCLCAEFVTVDMPCLDSIPICLDDAYATALQYRPEINAALTQIRDARVRLGVAENELLPALNLIVESQFNGLRGNFDVGGSFRDQFGQVDPGYAVGLEFKTPFGRRAAKANQRKVSAETAQLESQFQLVTEQVWQNIAEAVRELDTSFREMQLAQETVRRTNEQLVYRERRRELIGFKDSSASLYLEDLLKIQEQVATAELGYLQSQITYTQAIVSLKRAMGNLLYEDRPVPAP